MRKAIKFRYQKQNVFYSIGLKQVLLSFLLYGYLNINAHTQYSCHIDSINLLPNNPTQADTIKIICAYKFPYLPCVLDSSDINNSNYKITVFVHYAVGNATSPCHGVDTIIIGQLDIGDYQLNYNIKGNNKPYDTYNCSDSLYFTVSPASNLLEKTKHELSVEIYPSPASDNLTIIANSNLEIEIQNIEGQIIKTIFSNSKATTIDIKDLSSGVYIIKAKTDKEIVTKKFIKE